MSGRRPDADDWLERLRLVVLWRNLDELDEIICPPILTLRTRASPREQRWATFHAIAHVTLHRGNQLYMLRRGDRLRLAKQEQQADRWAAERLLPPRTLLDAIMAGLSFEELAEQFEVPVGAVHAAISLLEGRAMSKGA